MRPEDGPVPSTGFLVWHLSTRWRVGLDRALAPLGLTAARYAVLASLYGLTRAGAPPSQRELADYSGFEPMYVSKLIRALEGAGLVERGEHPADPRAVQVVVTEEGVERSSALAGWCLSSRNGALPARGPRRHAKRGVQRDAQGFAAARGFARRHGRPDITRYTLVEATETTIQ